MTRAYIHGYHASENLRLQDQASTLMALLHCDTAYPAGSRVLEAGCGIGAQTVTLAANSPKALITSIDISHVSLVEAGRAVEAAGLGNVVLRGPGHMKCPTFGKQFFPRLLQETEPNHKLEA